MEPQNTDTSTQLTQAHQSRLVRLGLLVLVVVIAAGLYTAYVNKVGFGQENVREKLISYVSPVIKQSLKEGDYEAAARERDRLLSDPSLPADQKAIVKIASFNIDFKMSGNVNDYLKEIAEMKKIALDPEVNIWTRVVALNRLAFAYCASGRDPLAFAELYKDEPFNKYLVPNDPDASARNLAEWSYSIKPTAFAAVRIARWYSQQYASNTTITPERREEYASIAKEHLNAGEELVKAELAGDPNMESSGMYTEYLFWRARDYGWLAFHGDDFYVKNYRQAFEDSINNSVKQQNKSSGTLSFTRNYYARNLVRIDKDEAAAKAQLTQLAVEMNALENPLTDPFVRVIRNESKNRPDGDTWIGIKANMKRSSEFKAAVERALALPSSTKTSMVSPEYDH